jgi:hypothetical protein
VYTVAITDLGRKQIALYINNVSLTPDQLRLGLSQRRVWKCLLLQKLL